MKIDLNGKTAVVIGSTGGIGLATAKGLARAGAKVIINGRGQDKLDQALQELSEAAHGAEVKGVAADLSTAEGCAALVEAQPSTDILINNLGIYEARDFFETSDEDWLRYWQINFMSGVRMARAYIPQMVERGWGRVLFLSSESAINIPPDMIYYGVTKAAYLALSRGLAKSLSGTGVTVNAILPGPTLTEGVSRLLREGADDQNKSLEELGQEFVESQRPTSIIQRMAKVEEVANLAVYLASPLSSATTGAGLRVDGGVVEGLT